MRLILLIALVAGLANACSCIPPGTPLEEMEKSDAVFSGKVVTIGQDANGYVVTFEVERAWKGVSAPTVRVRTAMDSAACGFPFVRGEKYLVYAYDSEGSLSAGLCSRTATLADAAEDVKALGPGTAIGGSQTGSKGMDAGTLIAIGAVILGIVLLAYVAISRKHI